MLTFFCRYEMLNCCLTETILLNIKKLETMKRTFLKASALKFIPLLFIAASLQTVQAKATGINKGIEILSGTKTASVEYAGSASDALFFNVKLQNPNGSSFTVIVLDDNGNQLFAKDFKETNFSKKFKLLKDGEANTYNYHIIIKSADKDLEQTFVIKAATRLIEDVNISKL